jgi:hypothetical protein
MRVLVTVGFPVGISVLVAVNDAILVGGNGAGATGWQATIRSVTMKNVTTALVFMITSLFQRVEGDHSHLGPDETFR